MLYGVYLLPRGCILRGLDESERLALEERHGAGVRPWRGKMEEKRRRVVFSSNLHERPVPSGRLLFLSLFALYFPLTPNKSNKDTTLTIFRFLIVPLNRYLNLIVFL